MRAIIFAARRGWPAVRSRSAPRRTSRRRCRPTSTRSTNAGRSTDPTQRLACYDSAAAALVPAAQAARSRSSTAARCARRGGRCSASRMPKLPFFSGDQSADDAPDADRDHDHLGADAQQRLLPHRHRRRQCGLGNDREQIGLTAAAGAEDRRSGADRWAAISCESTASAGVQGTARRLALVGALLGLEAGLGVDIGLLPLDAPISSSWSGMRAPVTAQTTWSPSLSRRKVPGR